MTWKGLVQAVVSRFALGSVLPVDRAPHDDFAAYDKAMAAERRAAVLVASARAYHS